jgi:hypothetical protein
MILFNFLFSDTPNSYRKVPALRMGIFDFGFLSCRHDEGHFTPTRPYTFDSVLAGSSPNKHASPTNHLNEAVFCHVPRMTGQPQTFTAPNHRAPKSVSKNNIGGTRSIKGLVPHSTQSVGCQHRVLFPPLRPLRSPIVVATAAVRVLRNCYDAVVGCCCKLSCVS